MSIQQKFLDACVAALRAGNLEADNSVGPDANIAVDKVAECLADFFITQDFRFDRNNFFKSIQP